jgi:CubicO group peptidase (beta-lactamase class C family)
MTSELRLTVLLTATGLGILAADPGRTLAQTDLAAHPHVSEALHLLDEWLRSEQAYEHLPGLSVAVVTGDNILWSSGYGFADIERRIPADSRTQYSGCSIAKLFTATAVMQLAEKGRIALDEPVAKHLPWLPQPTDASTTPINLEHLLTHSSGIVRDLPIPYWTGPDYPFPAQQDLLRSASTEWYQNAPGTRYEYSNIGMILAGEVVGAVAGMPLERYVKEHIFIPLGMNQTSMRSTDPSGQAELARGYSLIRRDGTRAPVPPYRVSGLAAVAGLVSTAEDLARFAAWQLQTLNGRANSVLGVNALRSMHQVQFMPADSWTMSGYGYQMWRENDRTFVGHAGTCPGFQSQLLLRPQDGFAAVAMVNAQGINPSRYTQRAHDILVPAIRAARNASGGARTDGAREDVRQYAGLYQRPLGSEALVIPWQGMLAIVRLPTANPLSSMELFEIVAGGQFRRSGARPQDAERIEFKADGGQMRMWRAHQYWVK